MHIHLVKTFLELKSFMIEVQDTCHYLITVTVNFVIQTQGKKTVYGLIEE